MTRYAIDVVILPPKPVMDLAITWNTHLSGMGVQSIVLHTMDTLPHISLLMGCLTADSLALAMTALQQVATMQAPLMLDITGLVATQDSHPVVALDIRLSPELSLLQSRLVDAFRPLITQDAREEDLLGHAVTGSALDWINRFIPDQCGERFWPHITLGHGRPVKRQEPFAFAASRLAICHLGDHCTCKTILTECALGA